LLRIIVGLWIRFFTGSTIFLNGLLFIDLYQLRLEFLTRFQFVDLHQTHQEPDAGLFIIATEVISARKGSLKL